MDLEKSRLSFGAAATDYDTHRPSYPAEALRWLLGERPLRVVDLGAGTGLLTRVLVALGHEVLPVEPDPGMRARLDAATPGVTSLDGSAEHIPLPDASVDAVVAGQAYHWFDRERAHPELARVIRPGGVFGPVWNMRDESVPWVEALSAITSSGDGSRRLAFLVGDFGAGFEPPVSEKFAHSMPMTADSLVALMSTRSTYLTAAPERQEEIRDGIRALTAGLPETFPMPYQTVVHRGVRR
ncbi:type 11 methyltransferase [Longispora fulva]|uniref:SAM-dependent methyltransferase n=1 Tax=Longispora fulva TaxID=619741 RepID=A0A8J7GU93_9ACTN|nr:class I SAM-dependent methyltransferase [Longispora fulva]MBG6138569.1 SAM-dependent methyltransferase [Longispora fulva]GIG62326.1 type 11 methyltransferase [Longispora fulva]